jgi:hypothetical protein
VGRGPPGRCQKRPLTLENVFRLNDGIFNRTVDRLGPVELPNRTARIVRQRGWEPTSVEMHDRFDDRAAGYFDETDCERADRSSPPWWYGVGPVDG